MIFDRARDLAISLLYPQGCKICGKLIENSDDGVACGDCWRQTHIFSGDEILCGKCGALLGTQGGPLAVRCHRCDEQHFDHAKAIGVHEFALAASINHLKRYPDIPKHLRNLIESCSATLPFTNIDLLMPVPLSSQRLLERGFDQALLIARIAAKMLDLPIDGHSLSRTRHTPVHRVGMDRKARELTLNNVFDVVRPKLIAGRNILLVDDVFTTGATTSACAAALKKAGAASVNVFTLARAVLN
ncbi:MAG: ComF family protein [Chloracidobacterium sp.]|nr:ComF family protein [Chloracidobacterium sp.]MCC6826129.1 ComF family protein [Acidobacteriota bacterium]